MPTARTFSLEPLSTMTAPRSRLSALRGELSTLSCRFGALRDEAACNTLQRTLQWAAYRKEGTPMGNRRSVTLVASFLFATLLVSSVPALADPFQGLINTISSSARNWAAALILIGA